MWRLFLLFVIVSVVSAKIDEDDAKNIGSFGMYESFFYIFICNNR